MVKKSEKCKKGIFIVDKHAKIVIVALQDVSVSTFIM